MQNTSKKKNRARPFRNEEMHELMRAYTLIRNDQLTTAINKSVSRLRANGVAKVSDLSVFLVDR